MMTRLLVFALLLSAFATNAVAQKKGKGDAAPAAPAAAEQPRAGVIWEYQAELGLTDQQIKQIKETITTLLRYQQDCRNRMAKNDRDAQGLLDADVKAKLEPAVKAAQDKFTKNNGEIKTLVESEGDLNRLRELWKSNFDTMVDLKIEQIRAQHATDANAALDKAKEYMKANVNILVEMQAADVSAARQINKVLSADQLNKWKDIQKRVASAAQGPATVPSPPANLTPKPESSASPSDGQ